jgi:hypothetical protein
MIPTDSVPTLDAALSILESYGATTSIRGRFVALYLGLRRMGDGIQPIGSGVATPANEIEQFLDDLYTKTHRPDPFVVLTAPFGQSTSSDAPYSARSGVIAPGRKYPTNTWRNNFAIQKGVGCPAEAAVIADLLDAPLIRLSCPHMEADPEGHHVCGLANTSYRGDEHSIWLRMTEGGYQVVELNAPRVYEGYLQPAGKRIPIFPLIGVLYGLAPVGAYPNRSRVGIPDFATDFQFSLDQVNDLFECDPDSPANAQILAQIEGGLAVFTPAAAPVEMEAPAPSLPVLGPSVELNTGVGAEIAVAEEMMAQGWLVVYRGNQRGFGYDLEGTRDGQTLRIEVKSSVGFTQPELTSMEWEAAQRHGDEYVLAVVDFFGSENQVTWYVRNPAANAVPVLVDTVVFRLPRADIQTLSTDAEFL